MIYTGEEYAQMKHRAESAEARAEALEQDQADTAYQANVLGARLADMEARATALEQERNGWIAKLQAYDDIERANTVLARIATELKSQLEAVTAESIRYKQALEQIENGGAEGSATSVDMFRIANSALWYPDNQSREVES